MSAFESEMAVLGSMMLSGKAAKSVLSKLSPEDFLRDAHQRIFDAFRRLEASGKPLDDFVLLVGEIGPELEAVGGEDYLVTIAEYVPSPANADHYAAEVKEASLRRQIAQLSKRIEAHAKDTGASLDDCRKIALEIAGMEVRKAPVVRLSDVSVDSEDEGVSTGLEGLDKLIGTKGYPKGQTTIVSAYHKGGKTAMMLGSCLSATKAGLRVCYATFADLNPVRIKRRMNRAEYGHSNPDQPDPFAMETCMVYDGTRSGEFRQVETFVDWIRIEHSQRPFDIAFVDYAQRVQTRERLPIYDHMREVSRQLAGLAEETGLPIVVGSQIQLGGKDGIDRTKGGTSLEEDAGWVIRIRKDEKSDHPFPRWWYADIESAYSRFGPMDVAIRVEFHGTRLSFQEAA